VASARAAPGEDGASVLCFHTRAEPVYLCSPAVIRPERTLWHVVESRAPREETKRSTPEWSRNYKYTAAGRAGANSRFREQHHLAEDAASAALHVASVRHVSAIRSSSRPAGSSDRRAAQRRRSGVSWSSPVLDGKWSSERPKLRP
jgi:hypothetical protein